MSSKIKRSAKCLASQLENCSYSNAVNIICRKLGCNSPDEVFKIVRETELYACVSSGSFVQSLRSNSPIVGHWFYGNPIDCCDFNSEIKKHFGVDDETN